MEKPRVPTFDTVHPVSSSAPLVDHLYDGLRPITICTDRLYDEHVEARPFEVHRVECSELGPFNVQDCKLRAGARHHESRVRMVMTYVM